MYQKDAGVLFAERCVVQHAQQAKKHGAKIHTGERMVQYTKNNGTVTVTTDKGIYTCNQLVLTVGAWSNKFASKHMGVPERQVVGWFEPKVKSLYEVGTFPIFLMTTEALHKNNDRSTTHLYGFPIIQGGQIPFQGFKIGIYNHLKEQVDPDQRANSVPTEQDETALKKYVAEYFPQACGKTNKMKECMFTNTADEHFVIDYKDSIVYCGGFSGHGFKFCSVVGEILADMATQQGRTRHNIDLFKLSRFELN